MSEEQRPFRERAEAVINVAFGGTHHVDKLKWDGDRWCEFVTLDCLSTWDFNTMTKLVVAAHDECVRAEVSPARGRLRVMLHPRTRTSSEHTYTRAHPTLEDHVARIRGEIDSAELARRLGKKP